ncbi:MAG: molybdopterin-dependent oxidoreductase [Dehalococcoidia bacterium]|nr:molybdopterin-dependent oxidoreductase [Dehalococcoidia bacterium]
MTALSERLATSRPALLASTTADGYRERWSWDTVRWASHCIDCYPGNCPMRVYLKDGKVVREESAAVFPTYQEGVPDLNPMGCQKGVAWSRMIRGAERVLYPLKRVGERGSGSWERVSWEQAATEIADKILDAVLAVGGESVVAPSGCNIPPAAGAARGMFLATVGGLTTDVNAEMNDFAPGYYLTYGTFDPVSSVDDWFHAELFVIWAGNPNYTRIPHVHFVNEARYKGTEVVVVAPDFSPSALHADYFVPVRVGSDAALALAMAQVVLEEELVDETFVREQTDLPVLVNPATKRYLRASDLQEGGSDEQLFAWDTRVGAPVPAPRRNLSWGEALPALEGTFTVVGKDGPVTVTTVLSLLRQRLADYTPERAAELSGVHADTVRLLARKVASKRTAILSALGGMGKHYHGDLMERAQLLLLALTGNWGRQGTGVRAWLAGLFDGSATFALKKNRGPEEVAALLDMRDHLIQARMAIDPSLTPLLVAVEQSKTSAVGLVPPLFWWYHHVGYRDAWNRRDWHDPSMPRPFDEYFQEAVKSGWWTGVDVPRASQPTRVLIEMGGNVLRRTRGGSKMLLEKLWPGLDLVVTLEVRMSTTALYSDYILPCAQWYEKIGFGIPSTHLMHLTFSDRAVDPPGEAVHEWEAFRRLAEKLQERARARGVQPYTDSRGATRDPANALTSYTRNGAFVDEDVIADEMIRDSALTGTLPSDASLQDIRTRGFYRWQGLGINARVIAQATQPRPDETFAPFRDHVEGGEPYPTFSRRAQFLIEHPWFIEADEHLPRHKAPPTMGGDYPFQITSGHNRWSVHSLNNATRMMLETHRGTPHLVMNGADAAARGIADNDTVRVFNDVGEFRVPALLSPSARPGQVVMYNGWDPYQFPNWAGPNDVEPGMIKWLHLAGGYGHLRYWVTEWQPSPVMRSTRVDVERA